MLCEKCKKNNATFHYRYNENGKVSEAHLCSQCSKKYNFVSEMPFDNDSYFSKGGMLDEIFGMKPYVSLLSELGINNGILSKSKICPSCGMSEYELQKSGKIGCKECYNTFNSTINAMLKKLHLSTEYKGDAPEFISDSMSVSRKIDKLKKDLQQAVDAQEYEEAAKLRDAIKQLEDAENK